MEREKILAELTKKNVEYDTKVNALEAEIAELRSNQNRNVDEEI